MKPSIIQDLVSHYPQLEHMRQEPLKAALDHRNAALLVGAYFQNTAERLESGQDPIPSYHGAHANEVRQHIRDLWNSNDPSKRTDALIRSYNPGEGQVHVNHVHKQMDIVRPKLTPLLETVN